jgi:hypothetical protein
MIESLNRERRGPILPKAFHSAICNTGAHLNKTIKPAPSFPWAGPSISIECYIDQPWADFVALFGIEAEPSQCIWPITVEEYVDLA